MFHPSHSPSSQMTLPGRTPSGGAFRCPELSRRLHLLLPLHPRLGLWTRCSRLLRRSLEPQFVTLCPRPPRIFPPPRRSWKRYLPRKSQPRKSLDKTTSALFDRGRKGSPSDSFQSMAGQRGQAWAQRDRVSSIHYRSKWKSRRNDPTRKVVALLHLLGGARLLAVKRNKKKGVSSVQ